MFIRFKTVGMGNGARSSRKVLEVAVRSEDIMQVEVTDDILKVREPDQTSYYTLELAKGEAEKILVQLEVLHLEDQGNNNGR